MMLRYMLFVYCLIASRIDINIANNNSSTTKNCPRNDDELFSIQIDLLQIQDRIIFLSKAIRQTDDLNIIIKKINITEEIFRIIEKDLTKEVHKAAECSAIAIKMLNNHYDSVSVQLKNLRLDFEDFKHKHLPSGKIADNKGLRFNLAQEKLKQLINNTSDILKIVQDVYAKSSDKFDVLANLTAELTDTDLIYNFVTALQQEISNKGDGDPYKWIQLVNVMSWRVINQQDVNPKKKTSAEEFVDELYLSIKVFTVNALKAHAKTGTFEKNGVMDNLTTAVYLFDPFLYECIIEEFIHTSFEHKEYLKDIFDTILSHRFIQQRIKGLSVLFWKIKDSYKINNDITIDIASALYKIHSDYEFKTLDRIMRIKVESIIENLPTCARNIYFLPSVCLWNRVKDEYLTAGNSTFNHDTQRRNIVLTKYPLPGSHWYIQRIGDNFLFSSRTYPNEYLYVESIYFSLAYRYVFSWIPGNKTDKESKWNVRLNDDYCQIQSASYYEKIISSNNTSPEEEMHLSSVFTWTPRFEVDTYELQWQMRKCD